MMTRTAFALGCVLSAAGAAQAQDYYNGGYAAGAYGGGSVGTSEMVFRYDELERWKHGYIQNMPYYEGFHSFRPYNYHHVFSQSQTAAGWGMSSVLPYSQQFWHKYEAMTDLSGGDHRPVVPYQAPYEPFNQYPQPMRPGAFNTQDSAMPATVLPVNGQMPVLP